ncbi:transmembrane protein 205 [Megalops cyprinoides]|uniref:transmembrane protein 205 n=1 Tax=Megalops cyprinoides TaxID=118141 RepID=UPI0018647161|nr:transmembrane protein 205 [Megalops cyprinoides]
MIAKLLHVFCLSTYWGMQIWVTFFSAFVLANNLNRHTFGFVQSRLLPVYHHVGSACAFFNLLIFAMYHPRDQMKENEVFQVLIFFVCVTIAALNAQCFGAMTSEIMADMHFIEQNCGLGQDIWLSSSSEAYVKLCQSDANYKRLNSQIWFYHSLSSLCNLCCIFCNGYSLYYLAENLTNL